MHIPMPVKNTLQHLEKRLPSAQGIVIRVPVENQEGRTKIHFVNKDKVDKIEQYKY